MRWEPLQGGVGKVNLMPRRVYPVVRLEDLGSVLTLNDLAALMQVSARTMRKLATLEKKTDIKCLPVEVPGFKHRFTKQAVERWLRTGAPQRTNTRRRR